MRRRTVLGSGAALAALLVGCNATGAGTSAGAVGTKSHLSGGPTATQSVVAAAPAVGSVPSPSAAAAVPAGVAAQYQAIEEEIGKEGGQVTLGDWRVGYIVEPAEPWFEPRDGRQVWREPVAGETHHIEIVPMEASTGRVVPNAPVRLEVLDGAGKVVQTKPLNFYYSQFFHYANNFAVPRAGRYTLRARIDPPEFFRHAEEGQGPPLANGVTVTFADVELGIPQ